MLAGIAVTLLIFAVSIYMPILGLLSALFIPVPVLFYRSLLGRRGGAVVAAVTLAVVMIVAGGLSFEAAFFGCLILLGFAMAELLQLNLAVETTMLAATGAILLIGLLTLIVNSMATHTGISALVADYVRRNLEFSLALYKRMGMSAENVRLIADSLREIQNGIVRIFPGLAVASTLLVAWINLLAGRLALVRRKMFFPAYGALNRWRPPDALVWGLIGCGGLMLTGINALKALGLNGLIIVLTVYFFAGIAVVSFLLNKKRLPLLLKIFFYSLIALQQLLLLLVIALGIFDTWLNLRKLRTGRAQSDGP